MKKMSPEIRIGTSGWLYYHWADRFYPKKLSKDKWLNYYCRHFGTVELNSTFYHLPRQQSVKRWRNEAPENFLYAVKASRFITHIKRLKDCAEPLDTFLQITALLKEKLGPVLFQLPPSMKKNTSVLKDFIKLLPKKNWFVFEFRHESWFSDDIYELLNKHNISFCIHDLSGLQSPRVITSDSIYIRFHGTAGRYAGNYSKRLLENWADWIKQNAQQVKLVCVYFNNDYNAYAVKNALQLRRILEHKA